MHFSRGGAPAGLCPLYLCPGRPPPGRPSAQKDTKITPEQTKELFRSLNQILTFASDDTQLQIRHEVKRRLITREEVEKYILDKFHEDKDAKRMQREEIVLKKFGLLDRDFQLQPFLVSLLKEQIAGYYDNKTKTVNLLDWVSPEEQKPVIAHELTHALQDQHTDLDKWEPDEPDTLSKNVTEDNDAWPSTNGIQRVMRCSKGRRWRFTWTTTSSRRARVCSLCRM